MIRSQMMLVGLLLLFGCVRVALAEPVADERFAPFTPLLGQWQGYTEKPDGSAPGLLERTYAQALSGKFIRVESVAMFPPAVADTYFEIHRDVEFISFDASAERFLRRGFYAEGFVTRESVTIIETPPSLVFESEEIENGPEGMRTRHTLTLEGDDRLVDRFEIAMPGLGFKTYQTAHLRRLGGGTEE